MLAFLVARHGNLWHNYNMAKKTDVDKALIAAAQKAGCEVAEDETILIKSRSGMLVSFAFGQDNLLKAVTAANKLGVHIPIRENSAATVQPVEAPKPAGGSFTVQATSNKNLWFDVLDDAGNPVNEKRLRKADAEKLAEELMQNAG